MKIGKFIKISVFLVFFGVLFILSEKVLEEKWLDSDQDICKYNSFYELPENTLDYIVLGASGSFFSINPMLIYAQEGYTGYNLGSAVQTIELSYYWLQEACKYQKPEYVFIDASSFLYDENDKSKETLIRGMTYMKFSELKLRAAKECRLPEMSKIELISPIYTFHDRWKGLTEDDFDFSNHYYPFKGSCISFRTNKHTIKDMANSDKYILYTNEDYKMYETEISEENANIFKKMFSFCVINDITLIPFKGLTMYWGDDETFVVDQFLSSYGLKLLDLNKEVHNLNWDTDTLDEGRHPNYWGNSKASYRLASYMKKEQKLCDHRNDERYALWNEDLEQYKEFEDSNLITDRERVLEYFRILENNKDKLCIIFSGKDDVCESWDVELQTYAEKFGLTSDFYNNIQNSYIGIIDGGEVILDNFSDSPLRAEYTIQLNNGESSLLYIKSGGFVYGNTSQILVEKKDYSMNERGINVVVLDKNNGQVISSASIDTWSEDWKFEEDIRNEEVWEKYEDNRSKTLEEGIYIITSAVGRDYAFDIPEGKTETGLPLTLYNVHGDIPQQFEIKNCGDGLYTIRAVCSEKYISVKEFGSTNGTKIIQEDYTGLSNQKWFIVENNDGSFTIMSCYNHLFIDVNGGEPLPGLPLQLYEKCNDKRQYFYLEKI